MSAAPVRASSTTWAVRVDGGQSIGIRSRSEWMRRAPGA